MKNCCEYVRIGRSLDDEFIKSGKFDKMATCGGNQFELEFGIFDHHRAPSEVSCGNINPHM